jgi:phage baseplate assembly protein W
MANPLSRFQLSSRTRTERVEYFDYISSLTPIGDFERIENIDVIINSWNNILLTPRGSYDHDPQYGSGLFDLIFEPADVDTENSIIDEIYNSIQYYDTRAAIQSVKITFLKSSGQMKGYNVKIDVDYNGQIKTLTLNVVSHG